MSPFKSAGVSVQSTTGSRGVRISWQRLYRPYSDVQCKAAGYPLHSHFSPSLSLPCVTVCHQVLNALYHYSDVVLGLTWSKDRDRYARGSVAAGRISHADSSNVPLARGWPLGPTSSCKNTFMSRKSHKCVGWCLYRRRSGCKEINNQEYDGRTSSKGTQCRSYEYEAGRDEMGIETNGGAVGRKPGPRKGL